MRFYHLYVFIFKSKYIDDSILKRKSQTIREQMLKLNTLAEWNYEYFTMDKVKNIQC